METQAPYSVSGAEQPAPTIFGPDVWAIVEIMGHKRVAGRIRKEGFGNTEMLVVETPYLREYQPPDVPFKHTRRWDDERQDYFDVEGCKIFKELPPLSIGPRAYFPNSIFAVNICTEDEAREEAKDEQKERADIAYPGYDEVIDTTTYYKEKEANVSQVPETETLDIDKQKATYGPGEEPEPFADAFGNSEIIDE